MLEYDWNFSFLGAYKDAFIRGAGITLYVSVLSFVVGTLAGILIGIVWKKIPGSKVLFLLNDAVRAIPPLVLIFIAYYFPYQKVLGMPSPSAMNCSILALAVSQASYTIDLVRAAIDNVSEKTIDAAKSLGLKNYSIMRYLILPDILRQMLPAQIAFFIGIIRLSNLASVVGTQDLVFVARTAISQNYRSLEAWILVAGIYILLVLPITWLCRILEKSKWLKRRW